MLIDTHAHLNFSAYKDDLDRVIERTLAENIWLINVGSRYETSKRAVEIAQNYQQGVYAAVGLHPIYSGSEFVKIKTDENEGNFKAKAENFDEKKYRELAKSEKVVAIGEIGLDYYYRPKTRTKLELFKEKQKQDFSAQLELAKELNLPVIFHCRMAHQEMIEILEDFQTKKRRIAGVIHCYTGTWEQTEEYLKMGFYIGLNGIIFKFDLEKVIKELPLERILVETDCPYLSPPPFENQRNEPLYTKYIVKKIADIKNLAFEEIAETTTANARRLFGI